MAMINRIRDMHIRDVILGLVFAILAGAVLSQANPGTELPSRDSGTFLYMAKQVVRGENLYVDVWDSKPPAIFYINAFALKLGRGTRWGLWFVEFVFLFGAALASFQVIKKLWGQTSAIFGLFVWLAGLNYVLEGGNYTEEYPLVFHFISFLLLPRLLDDPQNRRLNFLLGVLFSASFLFRPNNALVEALVILALMVVIVSRRNIREIYVPALFITIGVLTPIAATSAYFLWKGTFLEMLDASIIYNLTYGSTQISASSPLVNGFKYMGFVPWMALIGYILAVFQVWKTRDVHSFAIILILVIGSPLAVYLSDLAHRNYAHYTINWLPFIALLAGFAWHSLEKAIPRIQTHSILPTGIALFVSLACFLIGGSFEKYQKSIDRIINGPFIELRSPISIYVENHTEPGETVLFWATHPGENFMSHRDAPYSNLFYPTLLESEIADRLNDDFFEDIKRTPPVLIVDMNRLTIPSLDPVKREEQIALGLWPGYPPNNLDEVFQFIGENYRLEDVVKDKPIYRLIGTTRP